MFFIKCLEKDIPSLPPDVVLEYSSGELFYGTSSAEVEGSISERLWIGDITLDVYKKVGEHLSLTKEYLYALNNKHSISFSCAKESLNRILFAGESSVEVETSLGCWVEVTKEDCEKLISNYYDIERSERSFKRMAWQKLSSFDKTFDNLSSITSVLSEAYEWGKEFDESTN